MTVSKILDSKAKFDNQFIPAHEALKILRAHSALLHKAESSSGHSLAKVVTIEAPYKPIFNRNHFKRFKKIIRECTR